MPEHAHEWTIVYLGPEPVGISCDCGIAQGLDRAPFVMAMQQWVPDIGSEVRVESAAIRPTVYRVRDVRVDHSLHEPSRLAIELTQQMPF